MCWSFCLFLLFNCPWHLLTQPQTSSSSCSSSPFSLPRAGSSRRFHPRVSPYSPPAPAQLCALCPLCCHLYFFVPLFQILRAFLDLVHPFPNGSSHGKQLQTEPRGPTLYRSILKEKDDPNSLLWLAWASGARGPDPSNPFTPLRRPLGRSRGPITRSVRKTQLCISH